MGKVQRLHFFYYLCLFGAQFVVAQDSSVNRELPTQLLRYEGNFTDSDGDGMTDIAELKYGYNPNDYASFPPIDFIGVPDEEFPISNSSFNSAKILKTERGIKIKWDNNQSETNYSRYSLTLKNGSTQLYYGGHAPSQAEVSYSEFGLQGNEILKGQFSEYNPENGAFVKVHDWFEINLVDYPLPPADYELAADDDKISFRLNNFSSDEKNRYIEFMRRVLPIIKDVLGNPAETFTCDFSKDNDSQNSWVTLDQGRTISLDDSWLPRLLVHEMIHMWKGKYAFSYSEDNWGYSDDLSGFEEIAEGLAYEILHDFVEAYPYDENTRIILESGAWWNWSVGSANFDTIKHQKHTGGGTFWSGEALFHNDRYSIAAMVIQSILRHDPNFMKNTLRAFYDNIENNSSYRPTREGLLDLWTSQIEKINNIDTRKYLEAIPIFKGEKLAQGYYPVIFQNEANSYGTTKSVLGSYAVEGSLWWFSVTADNIGNYNIPDWVKSNLDSDGYYYIDSNNQPFEITTRNIYGEEITKYTDVLDTGYQSDENTVPNNLFTERIEALNSSNLPQGLYLEELTFTNLISQTNRAKETFYSFGYSGIDQNEEEYSLMLGVDSKFAEDLSVTFNNKNFDLPIIEGCAILKTTEIAPNAEGLLTITVNSFEKSHVYQRALINAGSADGKRHQQLLFIDRDFDGIEDLYDNTVDSDQIEIAYNLYKNSYPKHRNASFFAVQVNASDGGTVETIGFTNGASVKSGKSLTVKAIPIEGYKFIRWGGDINSTTETLSFNVDSEISITAYFEGLVNYFDVSISSSGGGTVVSDGFTLGEKVQSGEQLELTAVAENGYSFTGWAGTVSESQKMDNPLSITVLSDISLTVTFTPTEFTPTITRVDEGIKLTWNDDSSEDATFSKYSLTLKAGERLLVNGEHPKGSALVNFQAFDLSGTETLRGIFTEANPLTGEWVRDYAWFEIKLTDYSGLTDLGNGWKKAEWFGVLFPSSDNWAFHFDLGWIYLPIFNENSMWIWDEHFGWYWTNKAIFPFLYQNSQSAWRYLHLENSDHQIRMYYNYNTKGWVTLGN